MVLDVVASEWFHGEMSKEEATTLLTLYSKQHKNSENAFLVRLSLSEPIEKNPFTVSKISKAGAVVHQRVYFDVKSGEHFVTVKEKGESTRLASTEGIVALVKLMTGAKMVKAPVQRTRFLHIFSRRADDMGYLDGDE